MFVPTAHSLPNVRARQCRYSEVVPVWPNIIARRASQIRDPVERLRYLRSHARRRGKVTRVSVYVCGITLLALATALAPRSMRMPPPQVLETPALSSAGAHARVIADDAPRVWEIESGPDYELYSNGLRIDTRFVVAHSPRSYTLFEGDTAQQRTTPIGIVFHSTENDLLPFEPGRTREILRTTRNLLHYIQERYAYHFMIDRFGRVYKIVREFDAADHAGRSVWWSGTAVCLNLNNAFFGVAFEGRTERQLTPAQLDAGRLLTAMLRSRFDIPAEDCVTHAQVSINPSNALIGWHTDLARDFPFASLALPNNYQRILPAISEMGFDFDASYLSAVGEDLSEAARRSQRLRDSMAVAHDLSPKQWRQKMQNRYRWLAQQQGRN